MDCIKAITRLASALFIFSLLSGCITPGVGDSAWSQGRRARESEIDDDRRAESPDVADTDVIDADRLSTDRSGASVETGRLRALEDDSYSQTPRTLPESASERQASFGDRIRYALRTYEPPPEIVDETLLDSLLAETQQRSLDNRDAALSSRASAAPRTGGDELRARSDLRSIDAPFEISSRAGGRTSTRYESADESLDEAQTAGTDEAQSEPDEEEAQEQSESDDEAQSESDEEAQSEPDQPENSEEPQRQNNEEAEVTESLHPVERFAASRRPEESSEDDEEANADVEESSPSDASQASVDSGESSADIPEQPVEPFDPIFRQAAAEAGSDTELVLSPGERTDISLPGRGWVFTGELGDSSAIELEDRALTEDSTEFTVRLSPEVETGGEQEPFTLRFELQDPAVASSEEHLVSIFTDQPGDTPDESAPAQTADSEQDNDEGAEEDSYDSEEFSDYSDSELVSEFDEAINNPDIPRARAILEELRSRDHGPGRDLLADAGQIFREYSERDTAKDAYRFWIDLYDGEERGDEVHFSLAELYEQEETTVSLRRSADHYETVSRDYPQSDNAQTATSRARRLTRHFVDIR